MNSNDDISILLGPMQSIQYNNIPAYLEINSLCTSRNRLMYAFLVL